MHGALTDAGYSVFWDQEIPPGTDWDSWIRDELGKARLVIVLWTKASVASPNVRHEAIIAREAGKLLPVMVDDLAPSDFPMGLFHVQALRIGRTGREFSAVLPRFLGETRSRLDRGDPPPRAPGPAAAPPRKRRRWLAPAMVIAALLLLAAALLIVRPSFGFDPDAPPVTAEVLEAATNAEGPARARVAAGGARFIATNLEDLSSSWVWAIAQGIAAAPDEERLLTVRFFQRLANAGQPDCNCYFAYSIPHTITNDWVILASARLRRTAPEPLLDALLNAQAPAGWWPISLDTTRDDRNAAVHATALTTLALSEARRAGIVPPSFAARVDAALRRAVAWLNDGPADGAQWADYPANDRRTRNLAFAAMASAAAQLAGGPADGNAARAFTGALTELPEVADSFASGAYVDRANGERYFDDYRHPAAPWTGLAAVLAYRAADTATKRRLRPLIQDWLETDLTDERLLRHDWMTGETLFLRALAVRELRGGG